MNRHKKQYGIVILILAYTTVGFIICQYIYNQAYIRSFEKAKKIAWDEKARFNQKSLSPLVQNYTLNMVLKGVVATSSGELITVKDPQTNTSHEINLLNNLSTKVDWKSFPDFWYAPSWIVITFSINKGYPIAHVTTGNEVLVFFASFAPDKPLSQTQVFIQESSPSAKEKNNNQ